MGSTDLDRGAPLLNRTEIQQAIAADERRLRDEDTFNKLIGSTVIVGSLAALAILVFSVCQHRGMFNNVAVHKQEKVAATAPAEQPSQPLAELKMPHQCGAKCVH